MVFVFTVHIFFFPQETNAHTKKSRSQKSAVSKIIPQKNSTVKKKSVPKKPARPVSSGEERKKLLIQKLSKSFSKEYITELFMDSRFVLDRSIFKSKSYTCKLPDGSERPYQGYYDPICGILSPKSLNSGKEFLLLHRDAFQAMYEKYGIDRTIIAAALRSESYFGLVLGDHLVITTLYTLYVLPPSPRWRDLALEHIEYFLRLTKIQQWDIFTLKGSSRGAIGIPQFMPFSYWHYAVDGNGDGKIDLFDPIDAIHSVANFYIEHGWSDTTSDQRKAITSYYGRDQDGYIDALLVYARVLKNVMEEPPPAPPEEKNDPEPPPLNDKKENPKYNSEQE